MKFSISPVGLLFLSAVILGAGCKKKQEAAGTPVLAPPEKVFSSGAQSEGQDIVPAEAEVKASSGPVELTLRVYRTKIKVRQSLYYQIELKNVGSKKLPVIDRAFSDPWAQRETDTGIHLDVLGPDGKAPGWASLPPALDLSSDSGDYHTLPPPNTKEGAALRKQMGGKSALEKSVIVMDHLNKSEAEYDKEHPKPSEGFWLEPGASTATVAWVLQDNLELLKGKPWRQPIGRFTELCYLYFDPPGKYRIRAVYDYLPSDFLAEYNKKHHLQPSSEQVLVKTPFIEFEVLP